MISLSYDQCDQMSKLRVDNIFQKVAIAMLFKIAPKVAIHLG